MKIRYKFLKNFNSEQVKKLRNYDINVETGFDVFFIDQDDPNLDVIKDILNIVSNENIIYDTVFSEIDRSKASYLMVYPSKMLGYPQPEEEDFEFPFDIYPYLKGVFEIEKTDTLYGLLKGRQINNFNFKKEPNWGSSSIGSGFWIEDFLFTKPETFEKFFEPLGIKSMPVLEYKTKKELKTVVQLVSQGTATANLDIKDYQIDQIQQVESWGIKKYTLLDKGFYPSFIGNPGTLDLFSTKEYFGSGGVTENQIIISQKLYQLLKKNNVKGLSYKPMEY
ncbi:hypothetical protein GJU39_22155 [Pedobacter petrophilus]|uniref:Uncharacterized protein n=1 Tax=Pedobacter petrophilus TaxID=1908241 RepID=A0A7K0G4P7_9SPHI|nr:hypothetical protein [Pedobacter petrophilus]MRX78783.1 hypothetical protein [Pedobacter petrophilus]